MPNITHFFNTNIEMLIKLTLSAAIGGLIGSQREHAHRPAGIRTYMLVSVASTLVMLTSLFAYEMYHHVTPFDPTRLSAQVISGIGFLGAGTILRDGLNVRGLTTAAGLWVVACIGLAIGIGFYTGAIVCAIISYAALSYSKKTSQKQQNEEQEEPKNDQQKCP